MDPSTAVAATSDDLRRYNLSRLLSQLHLMGPTTRSELVALTSLNRSTVAALVGELSACGLVQEVTERGGTVGRPSLRVAPIPTSAVVVTVEIRVDHIVVAIMGLGGAILVRRERSLSAQEADPRNTAEVIVELCDELFEQMESGAAWVGVGVSLPGIIDSESRIVRVAPNLGWSEVEFAELLSQALSRRFTSAPQVFIANDANVGALAERARGAGRNVDNLLYLLGDVGVGGGVVLNGQLVLGTTGFAGEIGHMIVNPQGKQCRCGKKGCWETEVGRDATYRACGLGVSETDLSEAIRTLGREESSVAEGVARIAEWLGLGLVNLANAFDPDVIVLGGHLGDVLGACGDYLQDCVARSWDPSPRELLIITPSLGKDTMLIGAGELAFSELLGDPVNRFMMSPLLVSA